MSSVWEIPCSKAVCSLFKYSPRRHFCAADLFGKAFIPEIKSSSYEAVTSSHLMACCLRRLGLLRGVCSEICIFWLLRALVSLQTSDGRKTPGEAGIMLLA